MPSKVTEWSSSHGQRTSSHLIKPEFDLDSTRLSPAYPKIDRPISLHAHPRLNSCIRDPSGQQQTKSARLPSNLVLHNLRTYNAPAVQPSHSRGTRLTSQGTVIINRQNRRTGHRSGTYTDAAIVDNLRSQAERGYYEQHDGNGVIRRRSMLRAVSKEDYLLGRGANPRTGLITPGGGSFDSNCDEADIPPERNVVPSAKWRQQGDQWVSLDVDQPTPLSELPVESSIALPNTRTIQRQSKWSPGRLRRASQEEAQPNSDKPEDVKTKVQGPVQTVNQSDIIPDDNVRIPVSLVLDDKSSPQTKDKTIRRKPVGESPLKEKFKIGNLFSPKLHSTKQPTPPRYLREEDRSFSAPQLPKQSTSLVDATEGHSAKPGPAYIEDVPQKVQDNLQSDRHFLGVRSQTLGNLNQQFEMCQASPGADLDKALPCLPMSNGPYLPVHSGKAPTTSAEPTPTRRPRAMKLNSQDQERYFTTMQAGSRRSHIADLIVSPKQNSQSRISESKTNLGVCGIPNYDNPPRCHVLKSRTPVVSGPRSMPRKVNGRRQRPALDDVFTDPLNTTFMSTDTFIPVPNNHDVRRQLNHPNHRDPSTARPPPTIPLPPIPQPKSQKKIFLPNTTAMDNRNIIDISPPRTAPRGMARPNMPSRAIGLRQVPTMDESNHASSKTCMDIYNLSNLTGTATKGSQMKNISDTPESMGSGNRKHPALEISIPNAVGNVYNNEQTVTTDRTRRCSRCQDGLIVNNQHNTDGQMENVQHSRLSTRSANAPEALELLNIPTPITEITEPRSSVSSMPTSGSDVSATVRDVVGDLRDHSVCCPECCIMDCHEACLGHSRSSQDNNEVDTKDKENSLRRVDSSSTLVSTSGKSSNSGSEDELKNKISFIKSAFKLPFWQKKANAIAHKNSDEPLVQQTMRTRPIIKSGTKTLALKQSDELSGHDGAVAAAKKAIGIDSNNSSPEKVRGELFIPKKRAYRKAMNLNITKTDEIKELSSSPIKVSVAANECRKISASRPCSVSQSTVVLHPSQSRTVSNGSTDIRLPSMNSMGVSGLSQALFTVPFEAMHMWLYNNPEVMGFGKSTLEFAWSMGCEIAVTAQLLLNAIYIYSKTGKLKVKDEHGGKISPWQLMADSLRSVLYLLIFTSLTIIILRIITILFLPFRLLFTLCRCLLIGGRKASSV